MVPPRAVANTARSGTPYHDATMSEEVAAAVKAAIHPHGIAPHEVVTEKAER
jgi:hypothetical protein